MLSDARLDFIKGVLGDGIIVKHSMRLWKGNISFSCDEDDVNHWRGHRIIRASKYKLTCTRQYYLKEFKTAKTISTFFSAFCRGHCYKTKYGLFVPECHYEKFFEKHLDAKRRTYELRDIIIRDKDRLIEELKKQYVPVAHDMWQRRYGDGGEPTANYVANVVQKYVDRFPSDNRIKSQYTVDLYQINPFVAEDDIVSLYTDGDEHNMKVYRAFYDAIISRRQAIKVITKKFIKELEAMDDVDGRILAGICKRMFNKISNYVPSFHYDEELTAALSEICDTAIVTSSCRTRDKMVEMSRKVVNILDSNKMLLLRI
jgi:hypothetical protein